MKIKTYRRVLFLFCLGCQEKQKKMNLMPFEHSIKIDKVSSNITDDIIKDYKVVHLETEKKCLLGNIKKTLIVNDFIYVNDEYGIYAFDMEGKFKFSINESGRGPTEFIRINSFSIDDDKIFIFDQAQRKLISFDAYSGNYLSSIKLEYSGKNLNVLDDKIFLDRINFRNSILNRGNKSKLIVSKLESPKNIICTDFPYDKRTSSYEELIVYNKNAYWKDGVYNKLYKWNGEMFKNYVHFDFGKRNLSKENLDELFSPSSLTINKGKVFNIEQVYETPQFIIGRIFIESNAKSTIIYDKQSKGKIVFNKIEGVDPDLIPATFSGSYKDYFFGLIDSGVFYSKKQLNEKNGLFKEVNLQLNNILKKIKITDNPILIFYKFKEIPNNAS